MNKKDKEELAKLIKKKLEIQEWPDSKLIDLLNDIVGKENVMPVLTKLQLVMWENLN